jgi:DNA-binding CsgD family transcriptional regulator
VELFDAGPERDAVMVDWAVSLESAGRVPEAVAACLDLVQRHHEPRTQVRLHLALVRMFVAMQRPAEMEQHISLALQVEGLSPAQRARALQLVAMVRVLAGDHDRAEATAAEAERASETAGDEDSARLVSHVRAALALVRGHLGDARHFALNARASGDAAPDARVGQGWRLNREIVGATLGFTLIRMDRLDEAEALFGEARRTAEESGFRPSLLMAQRGLMIGRYLGGDWDDAIAEYEAIVDLCNEIADTSSWLIDPSSIRSLIAVHRGDVATARRVLSPSYSPSRSGGVCWPELAHSLVLEASGSPETALATLTTAWEYNVALGALVALPVLGADLVRLAVAQERHLDALVGDVVAGVDVVAKANPEVASIGGAALRCHGLAEDDPAQLLDASARLAKGRRALEGAMACAEAAELFARRGLLDEARPSFEDAIARFRTLGASWDAGRAASRARACGIRLGQRGARDRPPDGWAALTGSERRVVGLVAQGCTNAAVAEQLFLSRNTVKAHITSALRKLSLSSRAELARVATRHLDGAPE